MSVRLAVARDRGLSEDRADQIDDYERSDLDERQKIVLRLVDTYLGSARVDAELRRQLNDQFTSAEIVELIFDISKYSRAKVDVALRLDKEANAGRLTLFDFDATGRAVGRPLET